MNAPPVCSEVLVQVSVSPMELSDLGSSRFSAARLMTGDRQISKVLYVVSEMSVTLSLVK